MRQQRALQEGENGVKKEQYSAVRLRIYISEQDRWQGKALYHALVAEGKAAGLGGATVFRGAEGFGAHNQIHTSRIVDIAADLPLLVEFIDREAAIERFLPLLDQMVGEGLVTIDPVMAIRYRGGKD